MPGPSWSRTALTLGSQTQAYSDKPAGTIIAQDTSSGATVKVNSRINVTVSAGPEPAPEVTRGAQQLRERQQLGHHRRHQRHRRPERLLLFLRVHGGQGGDGSSSDSPTIWPWDWFNGGGDERVYHERDRRVLLRQNPRPGD